MVTKETDIFRVDDRRIISSFETKFREVCKAVVVVFCHVGRHSIEYCSGRQSHVLGFDAYGLAPEIVQLFLGHPCPVSDKIFTRLHGQKRRNAWARILFGCNYG